MKQFLTLITLITLFSLSSCKTDSNYLPKTDIIPTPEQISITKNLFKLPHKLQIEADSALRNEIDYLKSILNEMQHYNEASSGFPINLTINKNLDKNKYQLQIRKKRINIEASNPQSIFWGIVSLQQLIDINTTNSGDIILPICTIEDKPQYNHRGMLLDCARHFFPVKVVKKYIRMLAYYKMNTLHWHLTEDQGWRIEIKKYPKLTEVGAYRIEKDGSKYGGFYTQEEIKSIVSFAKKHHVNIIPEIEMPGHSSAAIASYPHLSCTEDSIQVVNDWGVFKDIYCPGKDKTIDFLKDVMDEVCELFPSELIHIGGDEAPIFRSQNCEKCQQRIKEEKFKDEHELQSYLINTIAEYLSTKGKRIIGWDEILTGKPRKDAIIQAWRSAEKAVEAANKNHQVIFSPTSHAYFDYSIDVTDLQKVYSFNLIPPGIESGKEKNIIGGEFNLWSEHIPDEKELDKKTFPRLLAGSDILWGKNQANEAAFIKKVKNHIPILEKKNIQAGFIRIPVQDSVYFEDEELFVKFQSPEESIKLKYQIDSGTINYTPEKLHIPYGEKQSIKIIPERKGKEINYDYNLNLFSHAATNLPVKYLSSYSEQYSAGGKKGITDGILGNIDFRKHWQAYQKEDFIVNLKTDGKDFKQVQCNFYQYNNAWIFLPKKVNIYGIKNKEKTLLATKEHKVSPQKRGKFIYNFTIDLTETNQYKTIQVEAENIEFVPDWHEAAGEPAWLFIDEVILL